MQGVPARRFVVDCLALCYGYVDDKDEEEEEAGKSKEEMIKDCDYVAIR